MYCVVCTVVFQDEPLRGSEGACQRYDAPAMPYRRVCPPPPPTDTPPLLPAAALSGLMLQVLIPVVCFAACIAFQTWEFVGSHDDPARARSLFKSVRAGWVKVRGRTLICTPADGNFLLDNVSRLRPTCECRSGGTVVDTLTLPHLHSSFRVHTDSIRRRHADVDVVEADAVYRCFG